jgi:hypothetical protein
MKAVSFCLMSIMVAVSYAGVLRWVGGDMGFSNADNWANGLAPVGNARSFCNTTFGVTGKTIVASLGVSCL